MILKRVLIFANGDLAEVNSLRRLLQPDTLLVAADGGLRHMRRLGLKPDRVIGDMDSLSAAELAQLEAEGIALERHPRDKDATDLELALRWAAENGCRQVRVAAALGGRLDQTLGNIALLAHPAFAEFDLRLDDGLEEVLVIRRRAVIEGAGGDRVSLLPYGSPAEAVTTQGLKYPLRSETLNLHQTRGISNLMLGSRAEINLRSGLLICIHTRLDAVALEADNRQPRL